MSEKEEVFYMAVKNFFNKEIDLAKRQAVKAFMQDLDKTVDKSIEHFVRIMLQAIKEEK